MSGTHAETVRYVRDTMLPEQAPPLSAAGPIAWVRTNLFAGWFNTIMTLLSLAVIFFTLVELVPWLVQSSWTATSLNECRAQIVEMYGEGTTGACWAVIRERYLQLIYGFYPSELYWRPSLAFVLLIFAVAPILFERVPRALLYLTVIYPFLGAWLMWGGTVWLPIGAFMGFVFAYLTIRFVGTRAGAIVAAIAAVVVAIVWWLFLMGPVVQEFEQSIPLALEPVESRAFGGFMLSILIGVTAIAGSLPLGILLALGRQSDLFIVKSLCVGFIEFIRGVPLITLLFVASVLLNVFLPPGTNFDIILRVMIMVTLFAAAYMAEVVRGGLAALPKGQYEAADALGLDYWKAQRLIIMPQALKISIPGIVSTFIGVFKDTTLVSIIGLLDPLGLSNAIRSDTAWNGVVWELYGFIALMFFIFCFSMSRYSMYLERKLQTGHR
ncbi:amino acid ABC transporter permease [Brevirhabdus pacifica]|uniref:Amino acid ABC transporter permease n=1 Tax=Brevirhabdus pacifica TaxID=1267768 RepID=A0A1U7DJM0_9RHOB|nr:amino acid ABC transporter permease [Brevirhabdus pacifica]APX90171.1 amino acid ABC transporter permease [Brevirhabdus pacifica]OWU78768.1 amino acid ABC transporter permease [Loktanella sp. 22II-4b]PJJ80597.1 L-glutamine ABC transporter membrane protein /L-glutamate ABC transporter membrane protein /L-aspartate ABC transporter membrane protein /L-asparagine ABC transporter membrane protein [Brevirhabdus pacifica]